MKIFSRDSATTVRCLKSSPRMFWERSGTDVWRTQVSRCWEVSNISRLGTDSSHSLGLTVGCVFSLLLFKRRMWPVTFGVGSGFGMGYSNCEHELNEPYMVHIKDLKKLAE